MRNSTIARSYAEALFELGEKHQEAAAYGTWLDDLARMIESSPEMRAFMLTPKIPAEAKQTALRSAYAGRVSPMFLNFLQIVVRKRRQGLFADIAREYHDLLDERLGRLHVEVTVARAGAAGSETDLAQRLSRSLGKTVVPHVSVDPAILGGVVIRYGDRVLDGSLRRQLVALRSRMLEAELPR